MLYRRCSPPSVNSRSLCLRTTTSSTHPPCTGSRSRAGPGFWALRKTAKSWRATVWRKPSPRHTSSPGLLKVLELQPVGVLNKYRLGCMYALLSAAALEAVLMKDVTSGAKLKDAFLIWFILSIIWLFFNCPVNMELHLEETKKKTFWRNVHRVSLCRSDMTIPHTANPKCFIPFILQRFASRVNGKLTTS